MAFIRNTDKFVEGLSNKFFTNNRAQLALQETVTDLQGEDSGMKLRLDVIEGGAGVEGSIAKAQADAQAYADQKVAALVNSAPEVLDTLKELSDAIGGDASFASTIAGQIGAVDAKVDQEVLDRQAAISALESAMGADVSELESADAALSLRLDELELDPVTKSYVDSQDSAEQSARQSADSALSGRLDVLEQDPTTKSYVDGEVSDLQGQISQEISDRQADVDAEEQRALAAEGLLSGRLDTLELDPVTKTYVDGEVSDLQGQITQEISDRQGAISSVEGMIEDEETRAMSAESALSGRLDILESDPVTKTYVDGEVSDLQGQVNTEKGRIDAILLSADADKDSFAEIVQLINSVDTTNDQAFAGYVASNNAALAQEVSDRQAGDSALSGRLDVLEADPTTKTYVDGIQSALNAEDLTFVKIDGSRPVTLGPASSAQLSVDKGSNAQFGLRATNIPVLNGIIGALNFQPFNGSGYSSSAKITAFATENHGMGRGSKLDFQVTVEGQTSRTTVLEMYGTKISVLKPIHVQQGFEMGIMGDAVLPGKLEFLQSSYNVSEQEIKVGIQKSGSSVMYPARFMSARAQFERGLAYSLRSYGVNRQINDHEPYIAVTAVNVTFTLPAAPVNGQVHTFKDVTGSCNAQNPITLSGSIDGGNSYQLTAPYESVMVMWNSTANMWMIL